MPGNTIYPLVLWKDYEESLPTMTFALVMAKTVQDWPLQSQYSKKPQEQMNTCSASLDAGNLPKHWRHTPAWRLPKHGKVGIRLENTSKHCQTLLTKYCARVFPDYYSGSLLCWIHTYNNRGRVSEEAPGQNLSPKEPWQWPEGTSRSTCDVQDCRYLIVTEGEIFGPKEWHWFNNISIVPFGLLSSRWGLNYSY